MDKQTNKSEDKHSCNNCGQFFLRKRYLKKHKKVCYQGAMLIECGLKPEKSYMKKHRLQCCVTKANDRLGKQMKNLDKAVVTGREFPCNMCDCSYQSAQLLNDHERSVHSVCSHSMPRAASKGSKPSLKDRKSSTSTNHYLNVVKPSSSKMCRSKKMPKPVGLSLRRNARKRCSECKLMTRKDNYHQHLRNHALSSINKKYLACFGTSVGQIHMCRYITCYLAFPSSQELIQHEKVHTEMEPYICGACDKLTMSQHKYNQHIKNCTSRDLVAYPCSYCGTFFETLGSLWHHYQSHSPDQMECYSCGHCGEVFPTRLLLNKHNSDTHQIIQPKTKSVVFQCNFCRQQLMTQKELLKHTKTYHLADIATTSTTDKPTTGSAIGKQKIKKFPCKYCDKSFRKKSKVARHERIHTNEKPHVCHICGLAFSFKSRLKQHRQSECNTTNVRESEEKAKSFENLEEDTKEEIDDEVIYVSSSPSPSPSPTPSPSSPSIGSIHIQRLAPVPVIGQIPSYVVKKISSPDTISTQNTYTTSDTLPFPRDQVYLIQYDQKHQGPLSIAIPNELSCATIRNLPTDPNDPVVPVKLERVL